MNYENLKMSIWNKWMFNLNKLWNYKNTCLKKLKRIMKIKKYLCEKEFQKSPI